MCENLRGFARRCELRWQGRMTKNLPSLARLSKNFEMREEASLRECKRIGETLREIPSFRDHRRVSKWLQRCTLLVAKGLERGCNFTFRVDAIAIMHMGWWDLIASLRTRY